MIRGQKWEDEKTGISVTTYCRWRRKKYHDFRALEHDSDRTASPYHRSLNDILNLLKPYDKQK